MSEMPSDKSLALKLLRAKAEEIIDAGIDSTKNSEALQLQRLFHELQIYQLELEMQNDELNNIAVELEHQKTKFSNLFELAPIGYMVLDDRAVIKDINATGSKLFGVRKGLLMDKPFASFVHSDDIQLFYIFFRKLLNSSVEQSCQLCLHKSNRQTFYVLLNGIRIGIDDYNSNHYITITDVSEKRRTEQEREEAKRRLDVALDASLTGIWEIDLTTGIVHLDDFSCSLLGIEPKSFDGRYTTLLNQIDENDRRKVDVAMRITIAHEKDFNIEFIIHQPSGDIKYVNARGQITTIEINKRRFIGIVTDITDKKQAELETQKLKENQQHKITAASLAAEENERKRISETLHDSVGQMLYAIKLNLQQLKTTENNQHFDKAHQLLDQTIRDVRNVSFELAPSILNDFGIEVTIEEMAKRLSSPNLTIQTKIKSIDQQLDINLALNIFRIVQELVNNSIKHAEASKITIELYKRKQNLHITVTDNGKGFLLHNQISTPSGTGLSSIKNRLNLYKGTMEMQSSPQQGTKVLIVLKH